jgi:hypothetical protein
MLQSRHVGKKNFSAAMHYTYLPAKKDTTMGRTTKAPDARATRGVNLSSKISIHPKLDFPVFRVQSTSLNDTYPFSLPSP